MDKAEKDAREIMSASYKGPGVGWTPHDIQQHLATALRARAERDAVVGALEWYANSDNYHFGTPGTAIDDGMDWEHDDGDTARQALAALDAFDAKEKLDAYDDR